MSKYVGMREPKEFPETLKKAFPNEKTHIARLRILDETLKDIIFGSRKKK